jgi:glycosyltransferase involved in cell wall biosynthesis
MGRMSTDAVDTSSESRITLAKIRKHVGYGWKNVVLQIFSLAFSYLFYPFAYAYSHLLSRIYISSPRRRVYEYDLVLIHPEMGRGWILEAACKEIARFFPGTWKIHYSRVGVPTARAYFIAHYSMLADCLKLNPQMHRAEVRAWYTHPRTFPRLTQRELRFMFNRSGVIAMNSLFKQRLVDQGVRPERVSVVLGAAEPALFPPHPRGGGAVGFSSAYYARKSPERIFEIIRRLPQRKFILLGKNWQEFPRFAEMKALPNLEYVETTYAEYPKYYARMDVFVSAARLEGGPIPLIESMMSNAVPVASRTGFAPDIIRHGENGFLFDVDAPAEEICALIEKAYALPGDIRRTVEHLSWENFSKGVQAALRLPELLAEAAENRAEALELAR